MSAFRGWMGETMATLGMSLSLDSQTYHRFDNIIIPTTNGTTQNDHILVSKFGIFVIETKNMKGWIFADQYQPQWTQLIHGRKYKFQNPLRQNFRHTKCLS